MSRRRTRGRRKARRVPVSWRWSAPACRGAVSAHVYPVRHVSSAAVTDPDRERAGQGPSRSGSDHGGRRLRPEPPEPAGSPACKCISASVCCHSRRTRRTTIAPVSSRGADSARPGPRADRSRDDQPLPARGAGPHPGERINQEVLYYLSTGVAAGMLIPDAADPSMKTLRVVASA